MLLRHSVVAVVALALVAISPVLSRPAEAPAPQAAPQAAEPTPAGSSAAETLAALEKDVAAADPGPAKKPAKRSQISASASQSVFASAPSTAETVSLSPQIPDPDKKGSAIQGILLNILHPKPIVDTIREEDKYGNTGDKFAPIGRGIVAGAQGVSQVLLKVLDFPFEAVKKVSRSATEALNNLGSKLIGL